MTADEVVYHELSADTLTRGDAAFIRQHVVDAYAAQLADESTNPITTAFALIGLTTGSMSGAPAASLPAR